LRHSAKLPRAELQEIHDELQGALAAVAEYFGRPDAAALADRLTQDFGGWSSFWRISKACVELAKVDNSLFTPAIVGALEQFSLLCPDTDDDRNCIRDNMETLRELTGQLPRPEVVPAADSQASSATDP